MTVVATGDSTKPVVSQRRVAPRGRSVVQMQWRNVLFLHWQAETDAVQRLLPAGVEVDTFGGMAWYGVVPFTMPRICAAGVAWPGAHSMHECNVRTYVRVGDIRGVWFLTLDANCLLPVHAGRILWRLNYRFSDIELRREGNRFEYTVQRRDHFQRAHLTQRYAVRTRTLQTQPAMRCAWKVGSGSLENSIDPALQQFLTERYSLFVVNRGGVVLEGRVAHAPWSLQPAEVLELDENLTIAAGLSPAGPNGDSGPLAFYSPAVDARSWRLRRAVVR